MSSVSLLSDHKEGYLNKLGAVRKNWKKRYFVLKSGGGIVAYYEDSTYKKKMGTIVVNNARLITSYPVNRHGRDNVFGVIPPSSNREFILQADSLSEKDKWITKFQAQGAKADELALKEGALVKSGENMKSWKTRWFTLLHDRLEYFAKKGDTKAKGEIPLSGYSIIQAERSHEKKFTFSITPQATVGSRKYLIVCKNDDELQEWLQAIKIQCEMLKLVGGLRLLDSTPKHGQKDSMDISAILGTNFDADDEKEEYNDDENEDDGVDNIPASGKPAMLTESGSGSGSGVKPIPSPTSKYPPSSSLGPPSLGTSYIVRESVSVFREGSPTDSRAGTSHLIESPTEGDSDDESEGSKGSTKSNGLGSSSGGSKTDSKGSKPDSTSSTSSGASSTSSIISESQAGLSRSMSSKRNPDSKRDQSISQSVSTLEVVRQGWMVKLGGKVKNWRARYFVLFANILVYYKTKEAWDKGEQALATIPFSPRSTLHIEPKFINAFVLIPGWRERNYVFITKDEEDRKLWMDDILAQIQAVSGLEETKDMKKREGSYREGDLLKLGAKVKNWRKRYFVLMDDHLLYFKNKDESKPLGTIRFRPTWHISLDVPREKDYPDYLFSLCPPKDSGSSRAYLLAGPDKNERDRWIQAIKIRISAQVPLMEGYLWKQGAIRKSWQYRYFSLHPSILSYSKSKKDKTPAGIISISYQTLCEESTVASDTQFIFTITPESGSRQYVISASNKDSRKAWVNAIQQAIQKKVGAHFTSGGTVV